MYATVALAAAAARDGDVIELTDVTLRGDSAIAVFRANNLTIRGLPARTTLDVTGTVIPNQKGIFVIQGSNTTVENIAFVGARVPDRNGAGIRQEGAGLTVRACEFRDNQDGILAGDNPTSDLLIESSSFVANGVGGGGLAHNLYINHVRSLTMRGCYSTQASEGHLFKSRALRSVITANRFSLESGNGSAEMDFPEGGVIYVIGNIIEQSATGANHAIIFVGLEAGRAAEQRIFFVNNTIVNDYMGTSQWFRVGADLTVNSINNLFVGNGDFVGNVMQRGSVMTTTGFVDRPMFDFRLTPGSTAVDRGVDPGLDGMFSLTPMLQYVHPTSTAPRGVNGAIDVGAYELGGVVMDGGTLMDSGSPSGDSGVSVMDANVGPPDIVPLDERAWLPRDEGHYTPPDSGMPQMQPGCSCSVPATTASRTAAPWALLSLAMLLRRRALTPVARSKARRS